MGSVKDMPNSGKAKKFQLQKMRSRHHEIVRQVILGHSDVEIANNLGVTPVMVRYTRESPIVADKIAILQGAMDADTLDIAKEIRALAPVALAVLEEFLLDPNHDKKERRAIAQDLLDRDGRVPRTHKTEVNQQILRTQDIEEIKKAAREAARQKGEIVDAVVVSEDENNQV